MVIKFWGIRGSIPVPGTETVKYGGNTPCVQIISDNGENFIIDAGTGIRALGKELCKNSGNDEIYLFLSHTHWDHIQGLPFFEPLFQKNTKMTVYMNDVIVPEKIFEAQLHPSFFPIEKDVLASEINYKIINDGIKIRIGSIDISTIKVHHTSGTLSYKFTENGKIIVYMTDNEILCCDGVNYPDKKIIEDNNKNLIEFCRGADYLIHDCMYNLKDFKQKKGWGHSNNVSVAYFSQLAKVKNLILFHYEPDYNDAAIDLLESETRNILEKENSGIRCSASKEGMIIKL